MKIEFRKLLMLCGCVLVWIQSGYAQLTNWQYASVIEIAEQQGINYTDEQVLVNINTAALIASGQMQPTGADIRFATDCDGNSLIDYYIESGINTTNTKVWLRVPQIPANATTRIYFFSGNPLAVPGTDFSNTFPNALIITAPTVTNLFGTLNYDWFEIQAGAGVNLLPANPLDITANRIKINGDIIGAGAGFAGGAAGSGTGGGAGGAPGALTANDGAGGAGYGGTGGDGGFTVTLYPGGAIYGNATDGTTNAGSGGGGTIGAAGGNGGGSVALRGVDVEITGFVNVGGASGVADAANLQGTGGGSGGTILISGRFVNVTGSLTATGGDGGTSVNPAFGGGGGGAGGRIKTFYTNATLAGLTDVTGGAGGCCGLTPSTNGGNGSTYQEQVADIYALTVNPLILNQAATITGPANSCVGTTETYTASVIPGDTYFWSASGGSVVGGQGTNTAQVNWAAPGNDTVYVITTNLFLGCADTAAFAVVVSGDLPVADFGFNTSCVGSITTFTDSSTVASGSIVSYAWDFGDGNSSTTQNPQNTYAAPGTYTVTLTVTTNNGCTASITQNITVEAALDAGFTATTECRGDSTNFTANAVTGFSYAWDFGDGTTSNVQNPAHLYASAGTFFVMLQVTTAGGCVSTETASVTVNAIPVVDFEFVSACPNDNVVFTNLTSVASGTLTYAWNFGDGGSSPAANPVHPYTGEGPHTVTLVATSSAGCSDSISKIVTVFAQPVADFSASISCAGVATEFTNASGIASGFLNYTWDFGDGTLQSNALNPTHVYVTSGTFTAQLIVLSNNGCADTTTGTAVVYDQPTASFTATTVCFGDSTVFTNTSTNIPGISYFWAFGDGNFSTADNPVYAYGAAGTYNVTLTVTTSDGCIANTQGTVTVLSAPTASFTAPDVCAGTPTQFTNTSTISGNVNFNWNFGDGNSSVLDNPLHTYAAPGIYTITLIASSTSGSCADTTTGTVEVKQQPNADFQILTGCFGSDVLIQDLSTSVDSGAYYQIDLFNDGIYDNGPFAVGDTASVTVSTTGNILVRIRVTNFSGCVDSVVEVLEVKAFPVAGFAASDACFGGVVNFTNTTSSSDPNVLGSLAYQWDFGDSTTSTDINPTHVYDSSGIFTVRLIAVTSDGCSDTITSTLIVYPLAVPDFTHAPACDDQDVIFTNTTTLSFGTWTDHWDFGDGTTQDTLSPTHRFNSIGVFEVELTVTTDAGCVSKVMKNVTVHPNPTANFIATEVCEGNPTEFTNLSSVASGALSHVWDFGDSFNGVDEDPSHTYGSDGSYDVVLIVTSDVGCTDTKTRTVTVNAKPNVSFTSGNVCDGQTVFFTNNSTVPAGAVLFNIWNFGDGDNSFDDNTSHDYDSYGTYSVKLFVQSEDGCSDSLLQAVIVYRQPNVLVTHNGPLTFCDGGSVTLAALPFPVTNSYTYEWNTNETDSSITVTTSGTFCVTVTDQNGCQDDTCEIVQMFATPVVTATASVDSVSLGYSAQLFASGGVSYQWSASPPDSTLNANVQNPMVSPTVTTTYTVTATDANGCTNTASVTLGVVDDHFVQATNVITPNGDPYNQNWVVENILTYPDNEVLVFDRWGTLVYQKTSYDNTWAGTHDGKDLPQGTYYYVIKFESIDRVLKGSVSIVR